MIPKLILCYELSLDELKESISFLRDRLKTQEILCLKPDELTLVGIEDYSIYCFHLDLANELKTHSQLSHWLLKNDYDLLNPFLEENNIFDDKYLFSQFLLANNINHPKTFRSNSYQALDDESLIVKARNGTEKKGFADYSQKAFEEILAYDDVLVQEKINIKKEIKILNLNGEFYADQAIENGLRDQIKSIDYLLKDYLSKKQNKKVSIYSMDILEDQDSNYYFLEFNLRPGALYRFKTRLSLEIHQ